MKTVLHVIGLFGLLARLVTAQLDSDMGPAAFLWPTDRAYSAANDNTAPCGSAAGVSNRTSFPMTNGAVAIVLQDESYNINLAISYSDNPTSNSDFTTLVSFSDFPELEPGHECYAVPNAPSTVSSGSNATLQLSYISEFETDTNSTFYVCADIQYVPLSSFTTDIPCFNVSIDDPTAVTSSQIAGASSTSTSSESTSTSSSGSGGSHLSGGAIAGIVVGVVAGAALISGAAFMMWRHYRNKALRERAIAVKMNELTNPARPNVTTD